MAVNNSVGARTPAVRRAFHQRQAIQAWQHAVEDQDIVLDMCRLRESVAPIGQHFA